MVYVGKIVANIPYMDAMENHMKASKGVGVVGRIGVAKDHKITLTHH